MRGEQSWLLRAARSQTRLLVCVLMSRFPNLTAESVSRGFYQNVAHYFPLFRVFLYLTGVENTSFSSRGKNTETGKKKTNNKKKREPAVVSAERKQWGFFKGEGFFSLQGAVSFLTNPCTWNRPRFKPPPPITARGFLLSSPGYLHDNVFTSSPG